MGTSPRPRALPPMAWTRRHDPARVETMWNFHSLIYGQQAIPEVARNCAN